MRASKGFLSALSSIFCVWLPPTAPGAGDCGRGAAAREVDAGLPGAFEGFFNFIKYPAYKTVASLSEPIARRKAGRMAEEKDFMRWSVPMAILETCRGGVVVAVSSSSFMKAVCFGQPPEDSWIKRDLKLACRSILVGRVVVL